MSPGAGGPRGARCCAPIQWRVNDQQSDRNFRSWCAAAATVQQPSPTSALTRPGLAFTALIRGTPTNDFTNGLCSSAAAPLVLREFAWYEDYARHVSDRVGSQRRVQGLPDNVMPFRSLAAAVRGLCKAMLVASSFPPSSSDVTPKATPLSSQIESRLASFRVMPNRHRRPQLEVVQAWCWQTASAQR